MSESRWRLCFFVGTLVVMACGEWLAPRRKRSVKIHARWGAHAGLVFLNTLVARFAIPLTAVEAAAWSHERGLGVFSVLEWPEWMEFVLAVVLLDLAIYVQHVIFHRIPILWRLHRVHHADLDLDVTSGLRFHTLEIALSMLLKIGLVGLLGASPGAVMAFEIMLNAGSLFSHSNVRIPLALDRWLRWVLVTPDMHRVHHSVDVSETNSNYGFHWPWWDYLFRTYRDQPQAGHLAMTIGLESPREPAQVVSLLGLLAMPFQREPSGSKSPPGATGEGFDSPVSGTSNTARDG